MGIILFNLQETDSHSHTPGSRDFRPLMGII